MLDLKFIRQNQDQVKKGCQLKNAKVDLDQLLKLDDQRKSLMSKIESLNSDKKAAAKSQDKTKGKQIKAKLQTLEADLKPIQADFEDLLFQIPNLPSDDTPIGKDDSDNVVIRTWGKKPEFDFTPKEHWKLGADLGIIDIHRATKVTGSRFNFLLGPAARLEFALVQLVFDALSDVKLITKLIKANKLKLEPKAFTPVVPPAMIRPEVMKRMARHHPEEMFFLERDNLNLIGSAEHTLGAMFVDETLNESELPLRFVGFSSAFRREAGSAGKDMKGILRVHQFDKIEMEVFSTPETGADEQKLLVAIQEHLMQTLEIPHQVVAVCTGDMGGPDIRQFDIEAWLPGQNKFRETHSADFVTDFQSRRLKTKLKRADGTSAFVFMNDATAFAIGRTLIAIMENNQQKDGSILIPKALQPFLGGMTKIEKPQT